MNMFFQPTFHPTQIRRPDPHPKCPWRTSLTYSFINLKINPRSVKVKRMGKYRSGLNLRGSGYSDSLVLMWKLLLVTTVPASILYPIYSSSLLVTLVPLLLGSIWSSGWTYDSACGAPNWTKLGKIRNASLIVAWI